MYKMAINPIQDSHRMNLEFIVGDYVFLKVSPISGVMRFAKSGKLSPKYIGPFENLIRVGVVACQTCFICPC